jgi:hypothetical protein
MVQDRGVRSSFGSLVRLNLDFVCVGPLVRTHTQNNETTPTDGSTDYDTRVCRVSWGVNHIAREEASHCHS